MKKITKKRFFIGIGALVLLLIIPAIIVIKWANAPVTQKIIISTTTNVPEEEKELTPIETAFFNTKAPALYSVRSNTAPSTPDLVQVVAFDKKGSGAQIGITSNQLPRDGLEGVADYKYRVTTPAVYTSVDPSVFPGSAKLFEAEGSTNELAVFMIHNGRYVSVVVSGVGLSHQAKQDILKVVMENWVWL